MDTNMGSIPLPALDIRPPQQQDPLENYTRLLALRNAMQNAPLQRQELQEQVQAGQIENQQRQIQLSDQKAMTSAMQQWDGKSIDDLAPLVIKSGGSANAVLGLKQKAQELKLQASTIAKNDADTGSTNVATLMKKNDLVSGALSTVLQTPDAQLPQAVLATAQDLAQKGLLDPQHTQMAEQIAQSGNPAQIRQSLDTFRKGMMSYSQLLDEAQKKAQTAEAEATTAKTNAEIDYYKQNGGAPGVPAENQELADFLKKNPGKGPADFLVYKAQHSPSVIVQNMAGGSAPSNGGLIDWNRVAQRYGMTPQAFDQQAEKYFQTGQLPPIGRSPNAIAMNRDLMNRASELHPNESLASNSAAFKANEDSLKKLQTNFDQVQAFENTAQKNMDLLQQTAQKIPDLSTKFANIPVRMINANMIGTANMAAFKTALATAQTEAAKVLNSSNATGTLSDSSRHELQDIIDGNSTLPALSASLNTLKQDMGNRTTSYQEQIKNIQTRMQGGSSSAAPAGGDIAVKAPNGKTYTFKDQASADAFKQKAGIQ